MMLHLTGMKSMAVLIQIAFITSILFSGSVTQPVGAVQSVHPAADAFAVPVTIEAYGKAWDGYLAFGLWDFPYSSTGFSYVPLAYLVVMTTKGQLLDIRTANGEINLGTWMATYAPVKYMGEDTLMFDGEPDTSTHFWNLKTNVTTDFPNVYGHHDMIFNPVTGTFLTLRSYVRQIDGKNVLLDTIVELDRMGNTIWTWDTYVDGHFSLKDECPCNDTTVVNGQTVIDLTHANSLQWDFQTNIVYMNMRHLNTFCKINKTTDQTVWCLGEHGDFTLLGSNGKQVLSLWYHAHDVREVQPDVFSMFDNDYHNTTNPANPCPVTFEETSAHSRMLEVTVNEENMTAWTSWSWTAPREYWSPYWGSVDGLPNGDHIASFGAQSHYLPGTAIGSPLPKSTGAVVVEVNPKGEVVRTYTFRYGWGIYRVVPIALQTIDDYDGTMRTNPFTINLTTLNDLGGPTSIYYRINNGPTRAVASDGQPHITTQGANNTLEYWSVDSNGIEESPHDISTGINLQKNVGSEMRTGTSTEAMPLPPVSARNTNVTFESAAVVVAVVAVLFAVVVMRKRSRELK
jgi:hypothetical protein